MGSISTLRCIFSISDLAVFCHFGPAYETLLHGGATLVIVWGILYWMQKNKIFLRI